MLQLVLLGLVAGMFFSATFILNRVISLEGGHWYWSAALRYAYMIIFLGLGISVFKGRSYFRLVLAEYWHHWLFWTFTGSIGFGGFYSLICFAADHSPGWVVATTWQLTIIASLFVLLLFGKTFSKRICLYSFIVFIGVFLVNTSQIESGDVMALLLGASPVLVAAFLYPFGNQLVWEAKQGRAGLPKLDTALLDNVFAKVFLLSVGTIPFWLLLYPFTDATVPSQGQYLNVALVALFSGVIATSLFLSARNRADNASKLAAVDATQSSEVLFALAGEVILLQAIMPNLMGVFGILIACAGLIAFVRHEHD